ncbi:MAG: site-specific DNA-methyltransferase [Verrucomicrobiales bacterium]|nr:site-specific DNA-methyltransferase [Verrucomicrobiales bacterium]
MSRVEIIVGDCRTALKQYADGFFDACVTSPPYWGLRDYGVDGQMGLESTLDEFVSELVALLREVRRVLSNSGTLWLNLGDSHASDGGSGYQGVGGVRSDRRHTQKTLIKNGKSASGLKPKNLMGIPWRVAFALQADGWYLRQDIIWHKPNAAPESATDRPTKAHDYLFLLSKCERYYYDNEAIKEPTTGGAHPRRSKNHPSVWGAPGQPKGPIDLNRPGVHPKSIAAPRGVRANASFSAAVTEIVKVRNKRSVWTIPTQACRDAHFATFPEALVKPCILSGVRPGGWVLDPFGGSGTTALVAVQNGRNAVMIELNPDYADIANRRLAVQTGLAL